MNDTSLLILSVIIIIIFGQLKCNHIEKYKTHLDNPLIKIILLSIIVWLSINDKLMLAFSIGIAYVILYSLVLNLEIKEAVDHTYRFRQVENFINMTK